MWVVAPSQQESMTHLPRSGEVSARRKDRIVVMKRNVPTIGIVVVVAACNLF